MTGQDYYISAREDLRRSFGERMDAQAVMDEVGVAAMGRVLDVGCGVGQALLPLAVRQEAFGIGVDLSSTGLMMGRELYATHAPRAHLAFVRARAEALPFGSETFDVVNCALALPYMPNALTIGEVARVLRPDGVFLLKIHHLRFYLQELRRGLATGDWSSTLHACRALLAGALYHLVRHQPRRWPLNETFQTRWLLRRELARHGLVIERERVVTNPLSPAFVIRKRSANFEVS